MQPPEGQTGRRESSREDAARSGSRWDPALTRRELLRRAGLGAGSLALTGLAAACEPGRTARPSPSPNWDRWWSQRSRAGVLDFANWPYYIDRHFDRRPSLELFTRETGIRVNYYRPIKDTPSFFEEIRPQLSAGNSIGYDLIVLTNGPEVTEMMESGWLIPLDHSYLGNFAVYAGPLVQDPSWDPGNRYTVAWQSGLTGIAFSPRATEALGREPRSVRDLWDPALQGRVGMMSDTTELGSFGLLAIGVDPAASTPQDWAQAADALRGQRDVVHPRYYDQGYVDALTRGDTWATMAWSGDIFQINALGHPEMRFVVPDEGAMLWTDNMMIPAGARHPVDAMEYIDFVYQPKVAAMIADWVWYITPVPDARAIIAGEFGDREVANSPLVFPGPELARLNAEGSDAGGGARDYYVYRDPREWDRWVSTFLPIVYGES
ncbi:MAG TPA: spermidine/putrescine ABC transporter substrate-binding protein [Actinomycetota bacterium]